LQCLLLHSGAGFIHALEFGGRGIIGSVAARRWRRSYLGAHFSFAALVAFGGQACPQVLRILLQARLGTCHGVVTGTD